MALESDEGKKESTRSKLYVPFLADPTDFLIVQHDALNNPNINILKHNEIFFLLSFDRISK